MRGGLKVLSGSDVVGIFERFGFVVATGTGVGLASGKSAATNSTHHHGFQGLPGGGRSPRKPVCAGKFPANRENNRDNLKFWPF
jgi:hypothetical protein